MGCNVWQFKQLVVCKGLRLLAHSHNLCFSVHLMLNAVQHITSCITCLFSILSLHPKIYFSIRMSHRSPSDTLECLCTSTSGFCQGVPVFLFAERFLANTNSAACIWGLLRSLILFCFGSSLKCMSSQYTVNLCNRVNGLYLVYPLSLREQVRITERWRTEQRQGIWGETALQRLRSWLILTLPPTLWTGHQEWGIHPQSSRTSLK